MAPTTPPRIASIINAKLTLLRGLSADLSLVYVDKAANLRKRIRRFEASSRYYSSMAFAASGFHATPMVHSPGSHRGGKLLWYLADPSGPAYSNVEVCCMPTPTISTCLSSLIASRPMIGSTPSARQIENLLILAASGGIPGAEIMPIANQTC
jgi:hypothetical protein